MPVRRPCPRCGRLLERSERCPTCPGRVKPLAERGRQSRHYDHKWRAFSRELRAQWVEAYGWQCPGWQREAHPSTDLVVDHDVGVLCRRCNAVKAATFDTERAKRRRAG